MTTPHVQQSVTEASVTDHVTSRHVTFYSEWVSQVRAGPTASLHRLLMKLPDCIIDLISLPTAQCRPSVPAPAYKS